MPILRQNPASSGFWPFPVGKETLVNDPLDDSHHACQSRGAEEEPDTPELPFDRGIRDVPVYRPQQTARGTGLHVSFSFCLPRFDLRIIRHVGEWNANAYRKTLTEDLPEITTLLPLPVFKLLRDLSWAPLLRSLAPLPLMFFRRFGCGGLDVLEFTAYSAGDTPNGLHYLVESFDRRPKRLS